MVILKVNLKRRINLDLDLGLKLGVVFLPLETARKCMAEDEEIAVSGIL